MSVLVESRVRIATKRRQRKTQKKPASRLRVLVLVERPLRSATRKAQHRSNRNGTAAAPGACDVPRFDLSEGPRIRSFFAGTGRSTARVLRTA